MFAGSIASKPSSGRLIMSSATASCATMFPVHWDDIRYFLSVARSADGAMAFEVTP